MESVVADNANTNEARKRGKPPIRTLIREASIPIVGAGKKRHNAEKEG
jgi:hypothetical protein